MMCKVGDILEKTELKIDLDILYYFKISAKTYDVYFLWYWPTYLYKCETKYMLTNTLYLIVISSIHNKKY